MFKVKSTKNGVVIYGYPVKFKGEYFICPENETQTIKPDKGSIKQLLYNKDYEIYEGDIVELWIPDKFEEGGGSYFQYRAELWKGKPVLKSLDFWTDSMYEDADTIEQDLNYFKWRIKR